MRQRNKDDVGGQKGTDNGATNAQPPEKRRKPPTIRRTRSGKGCTNGRRR